MSVTISAADVNKLRQVTGAGMMDCKKALTASGGDFDGAIEFLRKQGQKVADKRQDREATEGAAVAKSNDNKTKGVAICLSCETDFVAKNDAFVALAHQVADVALNSNATTTEELLQQPIEGMTLAEKLTEQVGRIGEKLEISAFEVLQGELVVPYIHMGNRVAVLVALSKSSDDLEVAGRDVAMQVAAMKPIAVDESSVAKNIIDREMEIGKDLAIKEGKPANIAEKIAQGYVTKYLKENTLVNQAFVKDSSKTVKQYVESVQKGTSVVAFKRIATGK
ncbi:MAG TPA: translation elongation factor Ts [Chitinophagales bacterium]|nr:translation elongation factor Ts [Chitinophagales bacterium]